MHEKGKGAPAAKTRRMTEWNDGWDSQFFFFFDLPHPEQLFQHSCSMKALVLLHSPFFVHSRQPRRLFWHGTKVRAMKRRYGALEVFTAQYGRECDVWNVRGTLHSSNIQMDNKSMSTTNRYVQLII